MMRGKADLFTSRERGKNKKAIGGVDCYTPPAKKKKKVLRGVRKAKTRFNLTQLTTGQWFGVWPNSSTGQAIRRKSLKKRVP